MFHVHLILYATYIGNEKKHEVDHTLFNVAFVYFVTETSWWTCSRVQDSDLTVTAMSLSVARLTRCDLAPPSNSSSRRLLVRVYCSWQARTDLSSPLNSETDTLYIRYEVICELISVAVWLVSDKQYWNLYPSFLKRTEIQNYECGENDEPGIIEHGLDEGGTSCTNYENRKITNAGTMERSFNQNYLAYKLAMFFTIQYKQI